MKPKARARKRNNTFEVMLRQATGATTWFSLRCRKCDTRAHTKSLLLARILGWSRLTKSSANHYVGLCVECRAYRMSRSRKHKRRKP